LFIKIYLEGDIEKVNFHFFGFGMKEVLVHMLVSYLEDIFFISKPSSLMKHPP
jgi:hypothetical protein